MDKRFLDIIVCPACQGLLHFSGESDSQRLISGELLCTGCGLAFPVEDEVALLVPPDTDLDWANWEQEEGIEQQMAQWVSRNFKNYRTPNGLAFDPVIQDFVNTLRAVDGPIIDIASGPGGSWSVNMMEHGDTDGLFVMSDLGKVVVKAWQNQLRSVGWAERCSLMVFDARRMPFASGSIAAITSIDGLGNVKESRRAYKETARVLRPNGLLLDFIRLFEEGGASQKALHEMGQAATSWCEYAALLHRLNFSIEHKTTSSSGKGKINPGDGFPLNDETWECIMVKAVHSSG